MNRSVTATFALLVLTCSATAAVVATNAPAGLAEPLPATKSEFSTLAIAAVTPLVTGLIYRWMPRVPKLLIPSLTPFIGIVLGLAINALDKAKLGWLDMAQAGALAVFLREVVNQACKTATVQMIAGGFSSQPPQQPPASPTSPPAAQG